MIQEREITVDVGCGKVNNLESYGLADEPTIALDISRSFLEQRAQNGSWGNLIRADSASLPVTSGSADEVFSTHVLEHVDDLSKTLDEIARIIKPGGRLTVAVPHHRFEGVMSNLDEEYHGPKMHKRVLREPDLRDQLEERGFIVVESKTRGFIQAVYTTLLYFLHRRILEDRELESQSGHLVGESITPLKKIKGTVKRLIKSEVFMRFFSPFDRIYPFELYMRVVKSESKDPS
jgi:ubiquinone/menaquinone biosynthesis C-methylase UbiE